MALCGWSYASIFLLNKSHLSNSYHESSTLRYKIQFLDGKTEKGKRLFHITKKHAESNFKCNGHTVHQVRPSLQAVISHCQDINHHNSLIILLRNAHTSHVYGL